MNMRKRLDRLEANARLRLPKEKADWFTDEEWLAMYEKWGREGNFDREPDFPVALAWDKACWICCFTDGTAEPAPEDRGA